MRFLLDVHMPPRLVQEFTSLGHECLQVRSLLPLTSLDTTIADKANELAAVMVSKDADFVDLHERDVLKTPLVWVRLGDFGCDLREVPEPHSCHLCRHRGR